MGITKSAASCAKGGVVSPHATAATPMGSMYAALRSATAATRLPVTSYAGCDIMR